MRGLVQAVVAASLLVSGCESGEPRPSNNADAPSATVGKTTDSPTTPEPCKLVQFNGRSYLLTPRPKVAGPGVGSILGEGRTERCGAGGGEAVTVYSVNEESPRRAITISTDSVRLYTRPLATADGTRELRDCRPGDLAASLRPYIEGSGGHISSLIDFRNTGTQTCLLIGYPEEVTVNEPGQASVTATRGSWFPAPAPAPVAPGRVVTLVVETTVSCETSSRAIREAVRYHEVNVTLRGECFDVDAPDGLHVGCGVWVSKFTNWG